jgi:YYY domain-containing protein
VRRLSPLVPLCLGALAFLNTWDFPIYWLVFVLAYALGRWDLHGEINRRLVAEVAVTGVAAGVLGVILYLPFYIGFQSQAGGLLPTLYVGTRFRQYFVMFGPFLVAIAGLLVTLAFRAQRRASTRRLMRTWVGWVATYLLVPLALMFLIVAVLLVSPAGRELLEGIRRFPPVYEIVGEEPWLAVAGKLLLVKLRTWVMPLVVAGLAALGTALLHLSPFGGAGPGDVSEAKMGQAPVGPESKSGILSHPSIRFVLICAVLGLLLTLSVEFFYLVDNFRVRMNTIFKFYFQGWVLMAIASAFAISWLTSWRGRRQGVRWTFLVAFWILFAMGMVYPILGNVSRANQFVPTPTLDGTAYLADSHPEDYAAIQWLNEHVAGRPVLLETPGRGGSSYVYEGRVSALTGLPTLLGWAGHEGQWRGSYAIQEAREPDIETLYNTRDAQVAETLMDQYEIQYVYVGPLERSTYDPRGLDKFATFMDAVYQNAGVSIYER